MTHRRRASPLHAARASAACGWCAALAAVALCAQHPVVLGATLLAALAGATLARVGREASRAFALLALPLALAVALVNGLTSRNGVTVLARLGELPPLGQVDVTLEALAYGALMGLRAAVVVLAGVVYALCVDPDEVLALLRRFGPRSALTATLATRLVPVLARDGRRLRDGQRCRPDGSAPALVLVRGVASQALERADDVAGALELRGFGARPRAAAGSRRRWSRHDAAFAASAVALTLAAVTAVASSAVGFTAYPRLEAADGLAPLALGAFVLVAALAPFLQRRGIER